MLRHLRDQFDYELTVCHFDHQLRPDSANDLAFVKELCGRLEVPFVSGEGDVGRVAREQKRGIEDAARRMRYQFLSFVAANETADAIATGHTADDQAETVLMRVIRGSGVRGIRGMLPSSPVPGGPQSLVRPILPLSRKETVAICREAGIEPLLDASNHDPAVLRNRLRHQVLPSLREVSGGVDDALRGLASAAREAFEGIERQSMSAQPLDRAALGAIFAREKLAPLPAEALMLAIERELAFYQMEPEVNRTRIENLQAVLSRGAGRIRFGDSEVEVSCGRVRIGAPRPAAVPLFPTVILNVPGQTLFGPWRISVRTEPPPGGEPAIAIDPGSVRGALRARHLAPGDRMTLRGHSRKVSDLLINAKVPAWDRPALIALAGSTTVVALAGATVVADTYKGDDALFITVQPVAN